MPLIDLSKQPDRFKALVGRGVITNADLDDIATLFNEAYQGATAWDNAVTAFTNAVKARHKHTQTRPTTAV